MVDIDRVWARVSQLGQFQGRRLADFIYQGIVQTWTLTTGQSSQNTPVKFPAGAIVFNIAAAAAPAAVAATTVYRPRLDLFDVAISYESQGRSIVGTSAALASSVFGTGAQNEFPLKEIVVPTNASILYTVTNRTTTTIEVSITHHALVLGAIQ